MYPVVQSEIDAGQDWDGDGKLEGIEKRWTGKPKDFEDADEPLFDRMLDVGDAVGDRGTAETCLVGEHAAAHAGGNRL